MKWSEVVKTFESSKTKNIRNKPISSTHKYLQIVRSLVHLREKNKVELYNTIFETLGIGVRTVRKVLLEYETTGIVTSPKRTKDFQSSTIFGKLDDFMKHAIRMKVHGFFQRKEIPTLDSVLVTINKDPDLPNF